MTKSIFAARLGICEIQEAPVDIPRQCQPVMSVSLETHQNLLRNPQTLASHGIEEQISQTDLKACVGALQANPQFWTSYSNSKQEANVICNEFRTEIMKDEALNLFSVLTALGHDISKALVDSLQLFETEKEASLAFAETVKDIREDHLDEITRALRGNRADIEEVSETLNLVAEHVSSSIASIGVSASQLKQMVDAMFDAAKDEGADLAATNLRAIETGRQGVVQLREAFQDLQNDYVAAVQQGIFETFEMAVRIMDDVLHCYCH